MFIKPMLLQSRDEPFDHKDYIFEPKMDGFRAILSKMNNQTTLYTRHQTIVTDRFPELQTVPIDHDVILDGEVVCYDPKNGSVDFEAVMERFQTRSERMIERKRITRPVTMVVFDILYYAGQDLRKLPLLERKAVLENVLADQESFSKSRFIEEQGISFFKAIQNAGLEGIVAKKTGPHTRYTAGRSDQWLKIINWQYEKVYLTGYRKDRFGWFAAVENDGGMLPVGVIEYGPSPAEKEAFYQVSRSLIQSEDGEMVQLEPRIQAKVKFRNYTKKHLMRNIVFEEFAM